MNDTTHKSQMQKIRYKKNRCKKTLINGVAADHINIDDRSIHYGDGLFETILCEGNNLFYWSQHYHRLQSSAQQLKIVCPDEQVLLDDIAKLLENNKVELSAAEPHCAIKIVISRGSGERGYRYSKTLSANRFVLFSTVEADYSSFLSGKLIRGDLCICQQQVSINESLAGLKHLNRLENVMARSEWNAQYIDGLMLNANNNVIEGTMSNLFAVRDKQLLTPDLKLSGVNGVMREAVIRLAADSDIKLSVDNLTLDDLKNMDELFITNSLIGMKSVNKLNDWQCDNHDVSDKLFTALLKDMDKNVRAV